MNGTFAAVVVVALFAITGCASGQPSGGGSASPSFAAPSLTPTPTSTPSPAASAAVPWIHDETLAAGTYRIKVWNGFEVGCGPRGDLTPGCSPSPAHDSIRMTLTVPDGWDGLGSEAIWLTDKGMEAPDGAGLLIGRGAWLLSDPCTKEAHAVPPDIAVGPSVEDFANALADHPLLDVTDPVDVTLAGYPGKYLDLQVPADISMCEVYRPWDPGIYAQGPGNRWHIWILDVDGLRIVVQSTDYAGTSAKHRAQLQAIVDSIAIEP